MKSLTVSRSGAAVVLLIILASSYPVVRADTPSTNQPPSQDSKVNPQTACIPLLVEAARLIKSDPALGGYALRAYLEIQKSISAMGGTPPADASSAKEIEGMTRKQVLIKASKNLQQALEPLSPGDPGSSELVNAIELTDKAIFLCGA
jgi:hypothetical protein